MRLVLENIGRRFNQEWIFKSLSYTLESKQSYAVLGSNGSGKSTLIQLIAGNLSSSEGKINYEIGDKKLEAEDIYQYLSLAAPYLELIEEFTLEEQLNFHFQFKKLLPGTTKENLLETLNLKGAQLKAIKYFSSGMKQRVKLALAVFSDTPLLLLDEPTANLDEQGIAWYRSLISQYSVNRTLVVCSNQQHEYDYCTHQIQLADYKKF
ncbi:MAG: ATP-binding cassette domain-containing protein [Sphingobacteriaceae bacterium]|nr:ATP-binding cassette domain-containing protein [Sphingobacteriaceae bacterium]